MDFPVSLQVDCFSTTDGAVLQSSGLPAESPEFVHPLLLQYSPEPVVDYDPFRVDFSEYCTGSSGVPLRVPVPISYHRTIPPTLDADILSSPDEYVGAPFDTDLLSHATQYDPVLTDDYMLYDDFKLTASEEAELVNAYTDPLPALVAVVEQSTDYDVLCCGGPSDDMSAAVTGSTPADVSVSDGHGRQYRHDQELVKRVTQRQTYFRAVAANVGMNITNPDTITAHDKKRQYIECLEEYVEWLEEQIRVAGHRPPTLDRISVYRGMTNRSLRTILVHKQQDLYTLNLEKVGAEGKFMDLQDAILVRRRAVEAGEPYLHGQCVVASQPSPCGLVCDQYDSSLTHADLLC